MNSSPMLCPPTFSCHELKTAVMSARACFKASLASSDSCCVDAIWRSMGACCRRRDCTKMDSRSGTFTLLASMPCSSPFCSAYRMATCSRPGAATSLFWP